MASGWESVGLEFKPKRLQATLDPGLQKNNKRFPAKHSVPFMKKNLQGALKKLKKIVRLAICDHKVHLK